MRTTHLLYLHGFRSSPDSTKARMLASKVGREHPGVIWCCPQLPPSPSAAMHVVYQGINHWPRESMAVIGSSLGGFYAARVSDTTGCKAVLLNPAVHPARDLRKYIGEQTTWHDPGQHFTVEPVFIDELRALERTGLAHPGQVLGIVAKGDEVLDWREMTAHLRGAQIRLLEESNHALSDFADHIDEVLAFLSLV